MRRGTLWRIPDQACQDPIRPVDNINLARAPAGGRACTITVMHNASSEPCVPVLRTSIEQAEREGNSTMMQERLETPGLSPPVSARSRGM